MALLQAKLLLAIWVKYWQFRVFLLLFKTKPDISEIKMKEIRVTNIIH